MKLKHLYLFFCALGIILPYSAYWPYFQEYGFSLNDFISKMFATPIGAFISYDLLVVVLALIVLIVAEGRRLKMKLLWLPIILMFFIGASFGFPLFLYLREKHLEKNTKEQK